MNTGRDWVYVILQFFLFATYLFDLDFIQLSLPEIFKFIMYPIMILGVFIIVISFFQLGSNLSPFPSPLKHSTLITSGLFKFMRHPIYTGILLIVFSIAIYKASEYKFLISVLLLILFHFKTKYEESKLLSKFPNYKEYRQVTGKFFPKFKGS